MTWTREAVVLMAVALLVGCSSQPRFTHHGGDPEQMFDSKTAQECWAGPVQKDNGLAELNNAKDAADKISKEREEVIKRDEEACFRALDKYPHGINAAGDRPLECRSMDNSITEQSLATDRLLSAGSRVKLLHEHPEEQRIIHVHDLPYCSDLK